MFKFSQVKNVLQACINAIRPARDWAVSCLLPHCGGLTSTHETPSLAPQLPERVWIYRRTPAGGFAWGDRWEAPWAPFFGTIGTVPTLEAVSSASPGPHGGNMDTPEIIVGHTLSLPVRVPGARFFVGDAHAAPGPGEWDAYQLLTQVGGSTSPTWSTLPTPWSPPAPSAT